jgi:hypothetical protein
MTPLRSGSRPRDPKAAALDAEKQHSLHEQRDAHKVALNGLLVAAGVVFGVFFVVLVFSSFFFTRLTY